MFDTLLIIFFQLWALTIFLGLFALAIHEIGSAFIEKKPTTNKPKLLKKAIITNKRTKK